MINNIGLPGLALIFGSPMLLFSSPVVTTAIIALAALGAATGGN